MDAQQYRELLAEIDRLRKKVEEMARRQGEATLPPPEPAQLPKPEYAGRAAPEESDTSRPEQVDRVDENAPLTGEGGQQARPREKTSSSSATDDKEQATRPGDGPPEHVAELLEVIRRRIADPEVLRESGCTLLFALIENREGKESYSVVGYASENDIGKMLVPDVELVRFAAAFTSPWRLKIIRTLAHRNRTSREIAEETGLVGGQLYHHLNELIRAGFVRQEARNCYSLTQEVGKPAYLGINALARMFAYGQARLRQQRKP
ncbi:MAG TPA: helix-turn-helix domain-containing protein [Firmicutes bacterium]|nr:helix-turn-helix domain-containing protein [Candidatus Fermentithermobacillaceae bacterium]